MDNYARWRRILILVVGILLLVLMGISAGGRDRISAIENGIANVISPVEGFFNGIGKGISNSVSPVFEVWDTARENEKLKKENIDLRTKIIEYSLREKELAELNILKETLNYIESNKVDKFVSGDVIGKSDDNWYTIFISNVGTKNGVTKNSTVINASGLVGSVYEVGENYSKIVTLLDEKLSISFETVDKVDSFEGITTGSSNGLIKGKIFDPNAKVNVGQTIITSGLGVHPKGIIMGKISKVIQNKDDFLINVEIIPDVNFRKIDKIMILPNKPGLYE